MLKQSEPFTSISKQISPRQLFFPKVLLYLNAILPPRGDNTRLELQTDYIGRDERRREKVKYTSTQEREVEQWRISVSC